ncbi:MAG: hypothetical protein KBG28_19955 [Kofleriaceae bacterium]|jgi:hypothetical protein|nr:hypothetical protein [Kofleriaceae bacterium]MBP6838457.1 hypothetical protein [Kofleriaceae bacterium]MBP9206257.1 hypothetical protein [Kofleriaceae bacterium]
MPAPELPTWSDEELEAKLFDYHEGKLAPEVRAQVERVMAARGEPLEEAGPASGVFDSGLVALRRSKAEAPADFTAGVAETIHRRSGGRFFGRRTLGDRVPFGVLLVLALVVLAIIAALMWSSGTGSLRRPPAAPAPPAAPGGVVPAPGGVVPAP